MSFRQAVYTFSTKRKLDVDGNPFRRNRFNLFLDLVDSVRDRDCPLRILDIGGTTSYWDALKPLWGDREFEITLINMHRVPDVPGYIIRTGNACFMPEFADMSFDVVHSNSVIEHVGPWQNIRAMANEVRRLAPHYYLQTPNFGFPIEPHFRAPFFHWLPETMRAAVLTGRKLGFRSAKTYDDAMMMVQEVHLLNHRQMKLLFPDAEIKRERFGPFVKSLIAIR